MNIIFTLLLLFILPLTLHSQNLIPNGDFEEYTQLPDQPNQLSKCKHWINPTFCTPDYFHTDAVLGSDVQLPNTNFATVEPFSGNGIAGLFLVVGDFREYISIELIKPLKKGMLYTLNFAHTNGSGNYFASCGSNNFGVYFSKTIPYTNTNSEIPVVPQIEIPNFCWDTIWKNESITFIADDNYTTITFGNFHTNDETTTIHMVQAVTSGNAYFFIDKAELIEVGKEAQIEMPNVFTPNEDGVNDTYLPETIQYVNAYHLTILNRWGEIVFETNETNQGWNGLFNEKVCTNGIYFWRVDYTQSDNSKKSKSGFLTLIR